MAKQMSTNNKFERINWNLHTQNEMKHCFWYVNNIKRLFDNHSK